MIFNTDDKVKVLNASDGIYNYGIVIGCVDNIPIHGSICAYKDLDDYRNAHTERKYIIAIHSNCLGYCLIQCYENEITLYYKG